MAKSRANDDYDPIDIDVHHLDREWQAQPRLMRQAALKLAEARAAARAAKAKLKLVEAELGLAIRRTPERYGFGGKAPSNDVVAAAVVVQQEYRLAAQELSTAEYHEDVFAADVTALAHKKSALENSVILWCRDYGSECKIPREHAGRAAEKLDRVTGGSPWRGATPEVEVE